MDHSPRTRRWRTTLRWAAAVALIVLVGRLGGIGWVQVRAAASLLPGADTGAVTVIVGLEVAWAVALAQTSRNAVCALGGHLRLPQALRISMAGFTLSRVVPGGGAAGGIFALRELRRLGHPTSLATGATVAAWATSVVALGGLLAAGLLVAGATDPGLPRASLPPVVALLTLSLTGGVVLAAVRREHVRDTVTGYLEGVRRRLPPRWRPRWTVRSDAVACDPTALRRSLAWAAVAWAVDVAAMGVAFAACGRVLAPGVLLLGYVAATLLNSAPELTPGWLGVFEAAQAATFASLGVEASVAVAAILLYRLLSFWLPTAAGVVPLLMTVRGPRRAVPAPVGAIGEVAS